MSSVVKGVKKVVSGVGNAIKKVVKGIGTVFKKVWDSPIGKIAIIAAAIYTGGVALGAWAGPSWLGGAAAVPGGAATPVAGAAAAGDLGTGAVSYAAGAEPLITSTAGTAGAATAAGAAGAAAPAAAQSAGGLVASQAPNAVAAAAPAAAEQTSAAAKIFAGIKSMAGGVASAVKTAAVGAAPAAGAPAAAAPGGLLGFLEAHPVLGLAAMQGYAAMAQKTPEEIQKDAAKRASNNLSGMTNVNVGAPTRSTLTRLDGSPVYSATGTLNPTPGIG